MDEQTRRPGVSPLASCFLGLSSNAQFVSETSNDESFGPNSRAVYHEFINGNQNLQAGSREHNSEP